MSSNWRITHHICFYCTSQYHVFLSRLWMLKGMKLINTNNTEFPLDRPTALCLLVEKKRSATFHIKYLVLPHFPSSFPEIRLSWFSFRELHSHHKWKWQIWFWICEKRKWRWIWYCQIWTSFHWLECEMLCV